MSPEQRQAVRDIIKRNGGPSVVARLCGVTVSTTGRWKSGKVRMPAMAVRLLEAIERTEA
jgi:DNA-binding transcriptional regulator YiaG